MAFGKVISFSGFDIMTRDLKNISNSVKRQAGETIRIAMESWLIDAKMLTPVDTGALRDSGRVEAKGEFNYEITFGGVVRKGKFVDYADEIHTNHPSGSGFLQKVVDARSPQLEGVLIKDLDAAINRA